MVMSGDNLNIYAAFSMKFRDEWQPVGHTESNLVQTLCDAQWRLHRAFAYELAIYANGQHRLGDQIDTDRAEVHEALTAALVQVDLSKELDRLSRHTSRINREFRNTLQELQKAQAQRKQREKDEIHQAAEIVKFCAMNDEPFRLAEFGFVLQTNQVETFLHRCHYIPAPLPLHRAGQNRRDRQVQSRKVPRRSQ